MYSTNHLENAHPIIIFTDELATLGGWHGEQLTLAFENRGEKAIFTSLKDCVLDFSSDKPAVHIPQLKVNGLKAIPKAALVRGIAGGTLQQVTMRLNILHILKQLGVVVYNDGRAIERTVDKAMTSFLLHQAGIATPHTWVCESREQAHTIIQAQVKNNQPLVIKPLFGSQGQGVRLLNAHMALPVPMDDFVDGVFYLQTFVAATHDYRVFVVNNRAVAAMRRQGESWLHNVAQGAKCASIYDTDILAIAVQAAKALDIAYCGVDIIRDNAGKLYVLEVNSIPAWRGLQSVGDVNIAALLADDLLAKLSLLNA